MKKCILLVIFLTYFFVINAVALEPIKINTPGEPGINIFIAESPQFIKDWISTPASHAPVIKRINKAKINQQLHAGFIVTGYSKDQNSKVNFIVAIKVSDPQGNVILDEKQWAIHSKKVLTEKGIILADPVLDLYFENGDPIGLYKITGKVTDYISNKQSISTVDLEITK